MKKSHFEQRIAYKTLDFIVGGANDGASMDYFLKNDPDNPDINSHFKNVCAKLSLPLIERLENTLGLLRMSKREFLELAIYEALDKVDIITAEYGLDDYLESISEQQVEA